MQNTCTAHTHRAQRKQGKEIEYKTEQTQFLCQWANTRGLRIWQMINKMYSLDFPCFALFNWAAYYRHTFQTFGHVFLTSSLGKGERWKLWSEWFGIFALTPLSNVWCLTGSFPACAKGCLLRQVVLCGFQYSSYQSENFKKFREYDRHSVSNFQHNKLSQKMLSNE